MKRKMSWALLAGGIALAASTGPVLATAPAQAATPTVKVMSRNLYFGADLTPAAQATSLSELLAADASIFTAVHATDFPARAKVLAREIKDADPDLIGVQELALWRQGPVGVLDGPATPSTEVVYDSSPAFNPSSPRSALRIAWCESGKGLTSRSPPALHTTVISA